MTGVMELYRQNMQGLAAVVFITCILAPLVQLLCLLYVLLPLKLNRLPWRMSMIFRLMNQVRPWGMMEVFLLGIFVSVVKLADMGSIIPGVSLYSFLVLIFVLAAAQALLDPAAVWERLDNPTGSRP